jgi:hypothetical protein
MCLLIQRDQEKNEKDLNRWFGSRTKFAYVYKRLRKWPTHKKGLFRSPVFEFIWDFNKTKTYQEDRSNKPTEWELETARVHKGFHVYVNLETAKKEKIYCDEVVVKFRVNKENIVAIENRSIPNYSFLELICTKLEFVKVIE